MSTRELKCPSCDGVMQQVDKRGVLGDICRDCRGESWIEGSSTSSWRRPPDRSRRRSRRRQSGSGGVPAMRGTTTARKATDVAARAGGSTTSSTSTGLSMGSGETDAGFRRGMGLIDISWR